MHEQAEWIKNKIFKYLLCVPRDADGVALTLKWICIYNLYTYICGYSWYYAPTGEIHVNSCRTLPKVPPPLLPDSEQIWYFAKTFYFYMYLIIFFSEEVDSSTAIKFSQK